MCGFYMIPGSKLPENIKVDVESVVWIKMMHGQRIFGDVFHVMAEVEGDAITILKLVEEGKVGDDSEVNVFNTGLNFMAFIAVADPEIREDGIYGTGFSVIVSALIDETSLRISMLSVGMPLRGSCTLLRLEDQVIKTKYGDVVVENGQLSLRHGIKLYKHLEDHFYSHMQRHVSRIKKIYRDDE